MKYVLIFFAGWHNGAGPATAEFGDKAACELAVAELTKPALRPSTDYAFCVPYRKEVAR